MIYKVYCIISLSVYFTQNMYHIIYTRIMKTCLAHNSCIQENLQGHKLILSLPSPFLYTCHILKTQSPHSAVTHSILYFILPFNCSPSSYLLQPTCQVNSLVSNNKKIRKKSLPTSVSLTWKAIGKLGIQSSPSQLLKTR